MLFLLLQWSAVLLCVCFCFFFIFESGRPLSLFLTSPSPLSLSLSLSLSFLHSCLIGVIYVAWWPTRRESTLQTLYSFFSLSFSLFFFHPLHLHHPFSVGILLLSASVASVCLPDWPASGATLCKQQRWLWWCLAARSRHSVCTLSLSLFIIYYWLREIEREVAMAYRVTFSPKAC